MRLYAGPSTHFIQDATHNQIAEKLRTAFFDRAAALVAVVAVFAVLACTSDDSRTRATGAAASASHLEEDLRLGSAAVSGTATPQQFGRIADVTTDSKRRIYVLDATALEIRVFDPSGTYSHTIGREGSGPGEFEFAREMTMGPGDTLWVVDDGTGRYTRFAPDGTFLDTHTRSIVGRYSSASGAVLGDGSFVTWAPHSPDGPMAARFLCIPLRLRIVDDSLHVDSLPPIEHMWRMLPSGRMPDWRFGGTLIADVDEDGSIWFAHTRDYTVYRRALNGDTTLTFSLEVTPPPVGEAEREYLRETFSDSPDLAADHLAGLPETKPIIHGIVADDAGHVFVFVDVADEPPGSVVDVFDDAGEHRHRLTLPVPISLTPIGRPVVHATSEHLYVVVKDDLDVGYVSRLRIVRGD